MDIIVVPTILLMKAILSLAYWVVVTYVVLNLLCHFRIINLSNHFVANVIGFIYRIVEPPLNFISRYIPAIGYIDVSPLVLIFFIIFVNDMLSRILLRFHF